MDARRLAIAVCLALFASACGFGILTMADIDRRVMFPNYKSFYLMKGNSSGDLLIDERAAADVRSALASRGWVEAPEGEGHAAVVLHAATAVKHTYETLYAGWGGWDW